ncbi:hypothetical protein SDC9_127515 [bioreactor metagenome]|uniref:Uncharacterized protein n=1 Tax=bioreactor metagenome TaxID=1076179 RepID=A0A645CUC4_9ZZZZ
MLIVSPGVPLPASEGVVSSVTPPLVSGPWMLPTSSLTLPMVGALEAVTSTVSANCSVAMLPATLSACTVYWCLPSLCSGNAMLQLPTASATTLASSVVPSRIVTVAPADALPEKVGVVSSVAPPLAIGPVMDPTSSCTFSINSSIPSVPTLKSSASLGWLVLPALSVRVTVML